MAFIWNLQVDGSSPRPFQPVIVVGVPELGGKHAFFPAAAEGPSDV